MLTQARLRELLDYDPLTGEFYWRVNRGPMLAGSQAGSPQTNGYIGIGIDGKLYKAHRLAWLYVKGEWPDGELDHDSLYKRDNSFDNLRPATRQQNIANTKCRVDNVSGFKGVRFAKGAWEARITRKGKQKHLGYYCTAEEAHEVYCLAADLLFGRFANHG